MAVRIAFPGKPAACKTPEDGLEWLAKHDLDNEVQFVRQVYMKPDRAKAFGEKAAGLGVHLSIHAPYYINLANPDKLEASKKRILDSCDRADKMGASVVVVHPGYYGSDKKRAYEMVERACREMAGKTSVLIGLETTGKHKQFGTLDEVISISNNVEGCVPVVDFAHMYAKNYGRINYPEILDAVKKWKHLHTHFSCIHYGKGGELNHLPLATKEPDFAPLVKEIKKRKLDIRIVCECPIPDRDALLMKRML